MKATSLLICLLCLLVMPSPLPLQAQAAAPAQLRVVVTLRAQANLSAIRTGDPAQRRRQIVDLLQATAADQGSAAAQVQADAAVHAAAGEVVSDVTPFWIFNGFAITASPSVIARLAASPEVLRITLDEIAIAPAGVTGEFGELGAADVEVNISAVQAPALWRLGWRGQGVVVASLDTGVDVTHPDLAAGWRGGANSWFDPFDEHPVTPADVNGHGTWTMGVIAGGSAGGTAIGAAPGAQWIAARIFGDRGQSSATAVHLAYQWLLDPDGNPATDDAPDVVNNSWTFTSSGCHLEFEQDLRALRAAGILPIFAAGNSGPGAGTSLSPGNNPSAFAVGATDDADQIYTGSSRGPSSCDSSLFPDLTAPGVGIHSSGLYGAYSDSTGTSLAAPHAAGVLALLLSAFPGLPLEQQEAALSAGARDLGAAGPDPVYGAGRLDGLAAYAWLADHGFAPQTGLAVPIHALQGPGHVSPLAGQFVTTEGIVTARRGNGFYLQAGAADADEATSEAIYVAAGQPAAVAPGDAVRVAGRVAELKPEGSGSYDLSVTQLVSPSVTVLSTGNALPPPVVLGSGGRTVPSGAIEDDALTLFDPQNDSLDFFESLESMRVQLDETAVTGPTAPGGDLWVLAAGDAARSSQARSAVNLAHIQLGSALYPAPEGLPALDVGARIAGPILGVLDYHAAHYALLVTDPLTVDVAGQAQHESTGLAADAGHLTVAAYHAGGLGGDAGASAFARRAAQIADNLAAPDLVLLAGMPSAGAGGDNVPAPAAAFGRLATAVQTAGGPAYQYAAVDLAPSHDGAAGDTTQLGFLYNPARVTVDADPGSTAVAAVVTCEQGQARLSHNPGQIDPNNSIWSGSARPLAIQVTFDGLPLLVVGMDLVSKAADSPLYGSVQPPVRPSDALRYAQASAIAGFVQQILACEPGANVLVLGNGNDQPGAGALAPLYQASMHNLAYLLPVAERYTTIVDGNRQPFQQAFASPALLAAQPAYDIVHINAEFAARVSDHDPVLARFTLPAPAGAAPRVYLAYIGR